MHMDPYKLLAEHLDALPNGYPATSDGVELKILRKLFTPDEVDERMSRTGIAPSLTALAPRWSARCWDSSGTTAIPPGFSWATSALWRWAAC